MKSSIVKHPKNLLEILVELTPDEFEIFLEEIKKKLFQETKISGFRNGKAPVELLKREIGETKIYEEAAYLAIQKTYWQIINQEKLEPIEAPKIEIQKLIPQNPFIYKAKVLVLPRVTLGEFKEIKIKRKKLKLDKEKIDYFLRNLQFSRRKETVVSRLVQKGDRVEMDIEMSLNKVPLENGVMKNVSYLVGEPYYLPNLEKEVVGLKTGEIKSFSLTYPANYYDQRLAGRVVDFKIKILAIYEIELPKIDDLFAQSLGRFKNLTELKNQIESNLKEELKSKEEEKIELEILEKLVNLSHFEEIPEFLIEEEVKKMLVELEDYLINRNLKFDDYLVHLKKTKDDLKKDFLPHAEKRIKTSLVLREIIKMNQIFVDEIEINQEIEKTLNYYQHDLEAQKNICSDEYKNYLKNFLLNRKAIQWLKSKITIN